MVLNLLSNARDALTDRKQPVIDIHLTRYTPDKSFLFEHRLSKAEDYAHITVADNGCGIKSENHAQIFEPFFTTKETGKGTGLGLAMVYGAVQTHGGLMKFESKQGGGARFHLFLPILDAAEAANKKDEACELIPGKGETTGQSH